MPKCYSPQKVIITPRGSDGKKVVKFIGASDSKYVGNGSIPCGKCIGCRLAYSSEWGVRCYLESTLYDFNYFVTFTYDDDNLPFVYKPDDDGVPMKIGNLDRNDWTLFLKRLRIDYKRKGNNDNIRYYSCGEYGDSTARPHYHAILFNLPLDDLVIYKRNFDGSVYYNSSRLSALWGKGHVVIAPVTFESAAYVARYVMKKQIGNSGKDRVNFYGLNKEFVAMSLKPGIGKAYFDKNYKSIYKNDEVIVPTNKGVRKFKPPSYFDSLYEKINPSHLYEIQDSRKDYVEKLLSIEEHDHVLENNARDRASKLKDIDFVRDVDV